MEKKKVITDLELWTVFNQASEAGIKLVDIELYRRHNISYIQLSVMYIIKSSDKRLSPTEISRIILREPHTTTALINRMQGHGLVKKTIDTKMKNVKRISLTAKGEEIYAAAEADETRIKLLSCLTPEEKKILLLCSEKIRNEALNQLVTRRIWEPLFGDDETKVKAE